MTKKEKIEYRKNMLSYDVDCLLNEYGVVCHDFSNDENNKKIAEVKKQIFDLINTLPKL